MSDRFTLDEEINIGLDRLIQSLTGAFRDRFTDDEWDDHLADATAAIVAQFNLRDTDHVDRAGLVLAVDDYLTNADLIVAAAALGHLRKDWVTLDLTYGEGVFWRKWRPDHLEAHDFERRLIHHFKPDRNVTVAADDTFVDRSIDFTNTGLPAESYDVVVLDPPYGLRGTVNDTNGGYGLGAGYLPTGVRHDMIRAGIVEAIRLTRPKGRVLVKCQDQVCEGRMHWQTVMFTNHAQRHGVTLVERLDMLGGERGQPERMRWWCLACGRGAEGSVGPKHRCAKVGPWLNENTDHVAADVPMLEAGDDRPWLIQKPSPQGHARSRPSSLLIFRKART